MCGISHAYAYKKNLNCRRGVSICVLSQGQRMSTIEFNDIFCCVSKETVATFAKTINQNYFEVHARVWVQWEQQHTSLQCFIWENYLCIL